jgi:large subunit ribosomal protein L10
MEPVMNANRKAKAQQATDLKEKFAKSKIALFADYKGLTAMQADDLRKKLRATDAEIQVLKNNVARLVTNDGSLGEPAKTLMTSVVGPTLVAFGYKDFTVTAKALHKFSLENEALKLKDSLMDGKLMTVAEVTAVATLPSRDVLYSMLLQTWNGPIASFVRLLDAVAKKKAAGGGTESAGGAEAAAAPTS